MTAGGNPSLVSLVTLLITAAVPILAGLMLLKVGIWPRRRGATPYCPVCGYNLTGLASGRCPECGEEIVSDQIVHGERVRKPLLIVLGCFLVVSGVTWLSTPLWRVNWYQYRPTAWVMKDVQSPNWSTARRAWKELDRRIRAGSLSSRQRSNLISLCLGEQAAASPAPMLQEKLDYLGQCYLSGVLSKAQQDAFFERMVAPSLRVRPRVSLGDPVPYEIVAPTRGPAGSFWMHFADGPMCLDGTPLGDAYLPLRGQGRYHRVDAREGQLIGASVPCTSLGRHTLGFSVTVRIYMGPAGQADASRLCHETKLRLEGPFEVLESTVRGSIRLVSDPSLEPVLGAALHPRDFLWSSEFLQGAVSHDSALPVNIAFDVFVRIAGKEHLLGQICAAKGGPLHRWGWTSDRGSGGRPPETLDLILRSSEKAARNTVDLFEIWQGELIYRDVPVRTR